MRLELGAPVHCTNDVLGELADVVIDPIRKRVTHLVVEPHHEHGHARLVPVELVEGGEEERREICSAAPWRRRASSRRCRSSPTCGSVSSRSTIRTGTWVFRTCSRCLITSRPGISSGYERPDAGIIYDRVPKGEVEIRRSSAVTSADGHHLGHVDGFLVDGEQITHIVLEQATSGGDATSRFRSGRSRRSRPTP